MWCSGLVGGGNVDTGVDNLFTIKEDCSQENKGHDRANGERHQQLEEAGKNRNVQREDVLAGERRKSGGSGIEW